MLRLSPVASSSREKSQEDPTHEDRRNPAQNPDPLTTATAVLLSYTPVVTRAPVAISTCLSG
ncbi:hypothetical protein GCM10023107_26280 [Actinoplanes octamycinicus]|nr:hypothetical protein Aoc01nite_56650 [Actinoplanes octamycinicus]